MNSGVFVALQTKDFASRKAFLEELRKEFDVNPICACDNSVSNNNHNGDHHNHHDLVLEEIQDDPSSYYPIILRLAHECPFKDVRFACEDILSKLEAKGVRVPRRKTIGPSRFISSKDCVRIDTEDHEAQSLFVEAFLLNGRTSHVNQLLAYHIRYFSCFLKFESHLMRSNGALPLDWRYYIGIMAASKHRCAYLVHECKEMFLLVQGNPKWLEGIKHAPTKLQKLDALNRLLAHQPWMITGKIMEDLLVGPAAETWCVSELIHAIVVIGHYLALSGLVFSCGVNPEIDMKNGHSTRSQSGSGYSSSGSEPLTPTKLRAVSMDSKIMCAEEPGTTVAVLERLKRVQQEDGEKVDMEDEQKLRLFQEVENKELDETETTIVDISNGHNGGDISCDIYNVDIGEFHYEEYQKMKPKNVNVFREQDFNWQQHCFSFLNRSFPNMGFLMDEKFKCTSELTYRTIGADISNIDTSKFRLATWNYIHLLYGIYHDDYLYVEVNKLLEKTYKSYIRKVACFPERITFLDFEFTDFLPSEKVHINLLVLESRFQAILLYATRSIMNYMNKASS